MLPPLKPVATLDGPVVETRRLRLRPWRDTDIVPAPFKRPLSARNADQHAREFLGRHHHGVVTGGDFGPAPSLLRLDPFA
jgi:hypothetical protein